MVSKRNERISGIILTILSIILFFRFRPSINTIFGFIILASTAFGIYLIFSKNIKLKKRLTFQQKSRRSLIGGIGGLIIGFWVIFVTKSSLGFIPAILGMLLLILHRK